jgi:hypothetical protein
MKAHARTMEVHPAMKANPRVFEAYPGIVKAHKRTVEAPLEP